VITLYDHTGREVPNSGDVHPWCGKPELLSQAVKDKFTFCARQVSLDKYPCRLRTGLVIAKFAVNTYDANDRYNPYDDEDAIIDTITVDNFCSVVHEGHVRYAIIIGDQTLVEDADFDNRLFVIEHPQSLSSEMRNQLIHLIEYVRFGVILPKVKYTWVPKTMSRVEAAAKQLSARVALSLQDDCVHALTMPDSTWDVLHPTAGAVGTLYRFVWPLNADGPYVLANAWYTLNQQLPPGLIMPPKSYTETGRVGADWQPTYLNGLRKTDANTPCQSNMVIASIPTAQFGKQFRVNQNLPTGLDG
jgi:hypothetical protein